MGDDRRSFGTKSLSRGVPQLWVCRHLTPSFSRMRREERHPAEGVRWRQTHGWGTRATRTLSQKNGGRHPSLYRATEGSTTVCTDELGPVVPRTFDPPLAGRRMGTVSKRPWTTSADPEDLGLRGLTVAMSPGLTRCALAQLERLHRLAPGYQAPVNTVGDIFIIADNLSSHNSLEAYLWLEAHPRLHQVFIPTGACWLNLQEGWWRLFVAMPSPGGSQSQGD